MEQDVPSYDVLLKFMDLQARCSETAEIGSQKRSKGPSTKKGKSKQSYTANVSSERKEGKSKCVACKGDQHSLMGCATFRGLPRERKLSIVMGNGICKNCLNKGHLARNCQSEKRCWKCKGLHHIWLHEEAKVDDGQAKEADSP